MGFDYEIVDEGAFSVIRMHGRLMDKSQAEKMLGELDQKIRDGKKHFITDLEKLVYMNSTGLNVMVNMLTKSRNAGGEVVLTGISRQIEELFIITKLNTVFTIKKDIASAEAHLASELKAVHK